MPTIDSTKIKCIVKRVGEPVGHFEWIANTLEALQHAVDGYIETITMTADTLLIVNEEGRIRGLPYNCTIMSLDLVGDILVCGYDGDEMCDVPMTLDVWKKHFLGDGDNVKRD